MMKLAITFLSVLATAHACADDHSHGHDHSIHRREYPQVPLTPPSSPLTWSKLNIIHTTDSHGFLLGQQKPVFPEPNYSGDLGDFSSFVAHMKEIALQKDVDLLLVDTGDLHDGTGLTDGYPAGGVDAHDANKFFQQLPYDILAIGNHELYIYNNTLDMYNNFVPNFPGRYLSSNVNITVVDNNGDTVSVPVGSRFAKFQTRKGLNITALGVLYDFTGNDEGTTVQPVASMVQEQWFTDAIADEPDLFLLAGHMPVRYDNWPTVFNAVRAVHPQTPIIILGGHTHIRDCLQLDGRSIAMESGRYMETVGWVSASITGKDSAQNISFHRRYMDANRVTYEYHAQTSNSSFDTAQGKNITAGLQNLANSYDLGFLFGNAPQDYYLSAAQYPANNSVLTLFIQNAVPVALAINNTRANIPSFMITNSGSQRFDLYSGPFTKNDQLTVSPFNDAFLYIPNIAASLASSVFTELNGSGSSDRRRALEERKAEMYARGDVGMRYNAWLEEMDRRQLESDKKANSTLNPGYVTQDNCPGVGDDTPHVAIPYYSAPDYIASIPPNVSSTTPIDLVFVDFIESDVLSILNSQQTAKNYTTADVSSYSPILANEALGVFAQAKWN